MTDSPDEQRFSRREAIAGGGAVALGAGVGAYLLLRDDDAGSPAATTSPGPDATAAAGDQGCVLTPEQTEGPYYVDDALVRRDVREDREGAELDLELEAQDADACKPVAGATVEIWHADAEGAYSAFGSDAGETFLRGAQKTGDDGVARFTTIYPGWYPGRTVHVHVKVHAGGEDVHTGQLYFDDSLTDEVYEREPYADRGERDVRNDADPIYGAGGESSLVAVKREGDRYSGALTLGVAT